MKAHCRAPRLNGCLAIWNCRGRRLDNQLHWLEERGVEMSSEKEGKEEEFNETMAIFRSGGADYGDKSAIESNKKLIRKIVIEAMERRPSAETLRIGQTLLGSQGSSEDVVAALELRAGRARKDWRIDSKTMREQMKEEAVLREIWATTAPNSSIQ